VLDRVSAAENKPTRSACPAAPVFGHVTYIYIAITALILDLIVADVLTPVSRRTGLQDGYDKTGPPTVPAVASGAGTPTVAPSRSRVTDRLRALQRGK
jgi:hypothetical protein